MYVFEEALPESAVELELVERKKLFSLQDVVEWVENHSSIDG